MKGKKHIIFLIFIIALIARVGVFAFVNVDSYIEDSNKVKTLEKQIQQLKNENNWLTYKIKDASTDAFIEKHAREDLMLAKKGETVIYFNFNKPGNSKNINNVEESRNFFEKMFYKLLHLFQK
jgi:cell division protein FtsB